jgi:hypothetical protein
MLFVSGRTEEKLVNTGYLHYVPPYETSVQAGQTKTAIRFGSRIEGTKEAQPGVGPRCPSCFDSVVTGVCVTPGLQGLDHQQPHRIRRGC